ncbi:NAD(P)H-dependent glycerol-3-phosphate dehydrogenase [Acidipila sp. EB88]|uniref:NAD(P)H-dependent glycerol-3-phosphate dehydrogenase n=1 Tax=Acidipila sp. EB88 TaxID=2305226 RepID=UPI000F5EB6A4|nr:NAD(P)H-dependent glycerol-3-phosphate dehydrogenase [Acidipila sp. EB88]RRA48829.1 NAD(P)-dependent glycerol-3-phosphate dehydrogenase [Acidipila sp. EB88]
MSRIAVLGAGAWGTALAICLSRRWDHAVMLWSHRPEHAARLAEARENARYLAGYAFPEALGVTGSLEEAVRGADAVLFVMPSQHVRAAAEAVRPLLAPGALLVSAAKGIEENTLLRMSQVLAAALGADAARHPIGVLSGPSFAQEVAAGAPAAVTVAFAEAADGERAQAMLSTDTLRLYRSSDVVGVELGGALKNVIAIAAGAVVGLELGHNSGAALITRGIAELTRLCLACGGRRETLAGLAGVGDLILTCTGALSRNRFVGVELGRGRSLAEIVASLDGKVAEGVRTTDAALRLAERVGVDMPIATQVRAVLRGECSAGEAVRLLMARPGREE